MKKLSYAIHSSDSFAIFKSKVLKFTRPCANSILNLYASIPQNGQTHPNNSLANCPKNCLSVFDYFPGLALKELDGKKSKGIKLITHLRLTLNHLCKQNFKNNVQDLLNHFCDFWEIESSSHYLLHCSLFVNEIMTLLYSIRQINSYIAYFISAKRFQSPLFCSTL